MVKIFKYELELTGHQRVFMPIAAEILSVQNQRGRICVWARVNPENPVVERVFLIFGTGHELKIPEGCGSTYYGTVQVDEFVWHIFEQI